MRSFYVGSLGFVMLVGVSLVAPGRSSAVTFTAHAETFWNFDDKKEVTNGSQAKPGGVWELGENLARAGDQKDDDDHATDSYADTAAGTGNFTIGLTTVEDIDDGDKATAKVRSTIKEVSKEDNGYFDYKFDLFAEAITEAGAPSAEAKAIGKDPQFIDTAGLFTATISLGEGSGLFAVGDSSVATSGYRFGGPTASALNTTFFSIDIGFNSGSIDADVYFADIPGLSFSTTANSVESLLEGSSSLNSVAGLNSALELLTFTYNFGNDVLGANAAFRSSGNAVAATVPEPSTALLVGVGMLAMVASTRMLVARPEESTRRWRG